MFGNWQISRRAMLRGTGAALSLPLLDVMSPTTSRAAESATKPARAAYLYIPNGVADGAWQPASVNRSGQLVRLNRWMQSLQPFVDDLTVFRNMWTPRGNGHIAGTATWLTGGAFDDQRLDVGGSSVDQLAARHFRDETLLPSLELSSRGEGIFDKSLPRNAISWVNAKTPVPRDVEPRAIFDRMFRRGSGALANRSVLDMVLEDARQLKRRASEADEAKIDEYLESVRSVERRLDFLDRHGDTFDIDKNRMTRPDPGIPEDHGQYVRTMLDMVVLAFWTDATRVATFMLDHGQSNRYFNFIENVRGTWHALSHWKDYSGKTEDDDGETSWESAEQKRDMYNRVTEWHTQQVAYFIDRLSQIEDGHGRLLDHSMIVYGSSLADGHEHAEENLPLLMAGGKGLGLQSGRVYGGRKPTSMSALHLAVLQTLGVNQPRFADAAAPIDLGQSS